MGDLDQPQTLGAALEGVDRVFLLDGHPSTVAPARWVGLRVDARYLHAFVDETATSGGYFEDYGYWRVSVGVILGGPSSGQPASRNEAGD